MKVIVCGGRDFTDQARLYKFLDRFHRKHSLEIVVEGDSRGVDRMAGYWARKNRIEDRKYPADWNALGKAAGPLRNQQMIDAEKPDAVIAFQGGHGTADMVRRAHEAEILVIEA